MDSERHGLYESVLKAFDSLLRVTSPRKNQAAGPKSLLAMCLRKVPAYIAALEHWERHEAEENETFAVRQYPKPCSADDDLFTSPALQPLRVLKSCDPSGTSIMPGILANLLAAELLPVDWVLNKSFVSLWPSTVRHVTHMKPCQGSVDLIVITLEVLCDLASPKKPRGIPQTRLRGKSQTTLISAIAALGSVVLLSEEGSSETPESSSTTRAATLRRRIEYVVTTCSANLKRRKPGGRKLGTYMLALCAFLSLDGETNCVSACTIETAWKGVQNCRGNPRLMLQYDATTALMSAVAHHCSRGTGLAPHVYLSRFCDKLEALDLPGGALNNMRVDGAFRLAEHTGDLRDLAFAEGLQAKAVAMCATPDKTRGTGGPRTSKTKKPSSFSGIRWDDGISEWVAATPATDLRPAGRVPQLRSRGPFPGNSGDEMDQDEGTSESESERGPETDLDSDPEPTPDDIDPDLEADNSSTNSAPETSTDAETEAEADADADAPFPSETETPVSSPTLSDPEPAPAGRRHRPHPATTKPSPAPPLPSPPTGGFLAAHPRRLSRPITRGGDELGFDRDQQSLNGGDDAGLRGTTKEKTEKERENWLGRNKPARFRPAKARPAAAAAAAAATVTKKRVARASLVYLQPPRVGGYAGYGGGDGESDDELSIL
ncbi:hypothetical protein NEMBOFW57_000665 [Staphylotrichum longicolle]|uniref:Uncharacterized protein n=1 Tax=Staphylotrichum longicolle TaxID=669026 RepID=A0AAD4F351_9PEZI|nr:hypothetical protein NEMBOFW57_000665 [Staphylotrichum longicolle]